jgi:hypothetical protein
VSYAFFVSRGHVVSDFFGALEVALMGGNQTLDRS